jgi:hypothetical protein
LLHSLLPVTLFLLASLVRRWQHERRVSGRVWFVQRLQTLVIIEGRGGCIAGKRIIV